MGLGESRAIEDGVGEGGGAGSAQRSSAEVEDTAGDRIIREGVGEVESAASSQVSLVDEPTRGPKCLRGEGSAAGSSAVKVAWALAVVVFESVIQGVVAAFAASAVRSGVGVSSTVSSSLLSKTALRAHDVSGRTLIVRTSLTLFVDCFGVAAVAGLVVVDARLGCCIG